MLTFNSVNGILVETEENSEKGRNREMKPRVNVSMKQETKDRLERIAEYEHKTMAGVLNDWVWQYPLPGDDSTVPGQMSLPLGRKQHGRGKEM